MAGCFSNRKLGAWNPKEPTRPRLSTLHLVFTLRRPVLAVGVVTGALGAHAMERVLDADGVGARHRFALSALHGAALLGALATGREVGLRWVVWGTVLFSGSIFGLLLGKAAGFPMPFLGPVTPIGGGLMIAGWVRWTWGLFGRIRG